jgi:hypothetical protein
MSNVPRPSHADYTYQMKYGLKASSGGGRASARETIGKDLARTKQKSSTAIIYASSSCWLSLLIDRQVTDCAIFFFLSSNIR